MALLFVGALEVEHRGEVGGQLLIRSIATQTAMALSIDGFRGGPLAMVGFHGGPLQWLDSAVGPSDGWIPRWPLRWLDSVVAPFAM